MFCMYSNNSDDTLIIFHLSYTTLQQMTSQLKPDICVPLCACYLSHCIIYFQCTWKQSEISNKVHQHLNSCHETHELKRHHKHLKYKHHHKHHHHKHKHHDTCPYFQSSSSFIVPPTHGTSTHLLSHTTQTVLQYIFIL